MARSLTVSEGLIVLLATIVSAGMLLCSLPNAAFAAMPTPAPSSTPGSSGPCKDPALSSITARPGIGRAPATSGSVCVTLPGTVVIAVGYRNQVTVGPGRQHLEVYPEPVALVGVADRYELVLAPGLAYSHRTGVSGSSLLPAAGQQDAGVGVQYLLSDRPTIQQALAFVATIPTGYPTGSSGFSAGAPSYALSYTFGISLNQSVALSTSQGCIVGSALNPEGRNTRYVAYQPTFNLSFALARPATLLLEDQISAPSGPHDPTGNRFLIALQETLSPNFVLDAEYEVNLLPNPGFRQHAVGTGITVRL